MSTADDDPGQPLVNHVGQCVTDLDVSRRFYCELLGFEVERTLDIPDAAAGPLLGVPEPVGLGVVYLRRGSFVLELLRFDRPGNPDWAERRMNEPGLTHISFSVDDLGAAVARAVDLGGSVVVDAPAAAFVRDPDGQLLELLPMAYRQQLDAS